MGESVAYPRFVSSNQDTRYHPVLVTYFSIVHAEAGMVAYHVGARIPRLSLPNAFLIGYLLHVLYEIKDMYTAYIAAPSDSKLYQHSMINGLWDQFSFTCGFFLAHALVGFVPFVVVALFWGAASAFGYAMGYA